MKFESVILELESTVLMLRGAALIELWIPAEALLGFPFAPALNEPKVPEAELFNVFYGAVYLPTDVSVAGRQ